MIDHQQLYHSIEPACQKYGVKELSIFGSRSESTYTENSDYDFVVEFDQKSQMRISDRFFGLLFFLEDTLHKKIDLLQIEAIRNPYLLKEIENKKKKVFEQ